MDDKWFKLYRREARNDSSGFEHVFVGECRDGKVIGIINAVTSSTLMASAVKRSSWGYDAGAMSTRMIPKMC